jgi:hypothetical protein
VGWNLTTAQERIVRVLKSIEISRSTDVQSAAVVPPLLRGQCGRFAFIA